jgi:hypothetical protein
MAICVVADQSGTLTQIDASSGVCAGYWLVTPEDKITFLERIFDPAFFSQTDYETLFTMGFTLPLIAYITAWAFQSVISFLNYKE